jgi:hypothetical protein
MFWAELMHIIRSKDGEIIALASRLEDAIAIADGSRVDKEDYIVQESTDQQELAEVYRSYYGTRSL